MNNQETKQRHAYHGVAAMRLYADFSFQHFSIFFPPSAFESPSYEGHSLSMLRRVAEVLGVTVRVTLAPKGESGPMILSEAKIPYRTGRKS